MGENKILRTFFPVIVCCVQPFFPVPFLSRSKNKAQNWETGRGQFFGRSVVKSERVTLLQNLASWHTTNICIITSFCVSGSENLVPLGEIWLVQFPFRKSVPVRNPHLNLGIFLRQKARFEFGSYSRIFLL